MKPIKHIQESYFSTDKTRYAFIDGGACTTIDKAYFKLQEQLSFPDYFSYNLDSLDEILSDLEWISKPRIRLIITDLAQLLNEEDTDRKASFLEVINEHQNERLEVYYIGKASA
jgi:RNAse (barnase) inhibitor barstar